MIRYALKCHRDHAFESWFRSADAFETLLARAEVTCPSCGSARIGKALMSPQVKSRQQAGDEDRRRLARLKAEIEKKADYVGGNFATEARRIHDGDAPERAIYGEARIEEARKLVEDGVPIAPLPFVPQRKAN